MIHEKPAGLSDSEVAERMRKGLNNKDIHSITKSVKQILKDNFFTFFNILNAVFVVLLALAGAFSDIAFIIIVVFNLIIGITQEISAKKTLDKLAVVIQKQTRVIRNGEEAVINTSDVVIDDILVLDSGAQICSDGIITDGSLEVNEALITGESNAVYKKAGDQVYSGSFVVSGYAFVKVIKVGMDNYASKISLQAKQQKTRQSKLIGSVNIIIKTVSAVIIPISLLVFFKQWFISGIDIKPNIVTTVASAIGMVPEGLVLLTSMALAASIVILAYKKILIQDLYSVENIARIDTLCIDKTGTLTKGNLKVSSDIVYSDYSILIRNLLSNVNDNNATFNALVDYYEKSNELNCVFASDFSSSRKYSCASFEGKGSIFVGAFESLFKNKEIDENTQKDIKGRRYVTVGLTNDVITKNDIPDDLLMAGIILLEDELRENVKETLDFFSQQVIDLKIISGDSVDTVEEVANKIGIICSSVDMSKLDENIDYYSIIDNNAFCRVLPEQKRELIIALKEKGHSVGMIGDGVNDVLALKKADCSISIANGSDAARNISDMVLLRSDFTDMPSAVNEGRKVINNIQRVATLFFTKTLYSIFIVLLTLIIPAFVYPFSPLQLTILAFITIGFPAFFISFEPDYSPVKGGFLSSILQKSLPGALCVLIIVLLINIFFNNDYYSYSMISTLTYTVICIIGFYVFIRVAWPFSLFRWIIFGICLFMMLGSILVKPVRDFIGFTGFNNQMILFTIVTIVVLPFIFLLFEKMSGKLSSSILKVIKIRRRRILKG